MPGASVSLSLFPKAFRANCISPKTPEAATTSVTIPTTWPRNPDEASAALDGVLQEIRALFPPLTAPGRPWPQGCGLAKGRPAIATAIERA